MAAIQGEVSADDLEAYKVAGTPAFALLDTAAKGYNPTTATSQEQTKVLCRWIAFALQSAGDAMLEADYVADPSTVGYVPDVTRRQALVFYEEVNFWAGAAVEAEANPDFRLGTHVHLPLDWPAWVDVEPCPEPHLAAMVQMADKIGGRVGILYNVEGMQGSDGLGVAETSVKQLLARGNYKRERAQVLWHQKGATQARHESMETDVKEAIAAFFLAGQLMAMPSLVRQLMTDAQPSQRSALPLPGMSGFDPWCLTDPVSRKEWKRDRAAQRAIQALWQYDPDPAATLRIQQQIDEALERGDIVHRNLGNYFCCPWSAIYQAVNPITIGDRRLRRGKEFTFDVSAEEIAEGGSFKREILVANFSPTNKVDYCNPDEGDHDDD